MPGKDVCVDENLYGFHGRVAFRIFNPNKPRKYGIKIWMLCDCATNYVWSADIYTGKEREPKKKEPEKKKEELLGVKVIYIKIQKYK